MSLIKKIFIPQDKFLFKYIFVLALPIILTNISRVLMGIVDLIMVGIIGIEVAQAAVGFCGMVAWSFMGFGISLRTGAQQSLWESNFSGIQY